MKKSTNLKRNIFVFVFSFIVGAFVILPFMAYSKPAVARAEEEFKPIISGNVYSCCGDSNFWPVIGDNGHLRLSVLKGDTEIAYSFINADGQYYIQIENYSGENNLTFKLIDTNNTSSLFVYLFNDNTRSKVLGTLIDPITTTNCYFRYFPWGRSTVSTFNTYNYNSLIFDSVNNKLVSKRVNVPSQLYNYYSSMDFVYTVTFVANYGQYPAFWANFNDTTNNFVAGFGIIGVYNGDSANPWTFYIKDNVTGFKVKIAESTSQVMPNFSVNIKLKTYTSNRRSFVDFYYCLADSPTGDWKYFRTSYTDLDKYFYTLAFQAGSGKYSIKYSLSFNFANAVSPDYTAIKQTSYNDGYDDGKRDGLDEGFIKGVNSKTYSFWELISSVVDVPVSTLTSIFDVDILGVNMKSFVFSIATLFIVLSVVRIWLGTRGV